MTGLAAVLHGARDLRLEPREPGPLAPGQVRVAFAAGGICGSDMHYFQHGRTGAFVVTQPLVLGHEIAGRVVETVEGGPPVGATVAVNPSRVCGHCAPCRGGRPNLCENLFFMGSASRTPHMQGGFSSFIDVAPSQCVPVPAGMPASRAALAEPLAVCLHAASRAGSLQDRRVTIVGAGPIGLILLLVARRGGAAHIDLIDVAEAPLRHAKRLGAGRALDARGLDEAELIRLAADDGGPEVVFEASGQPSALSAALAYVRRGGTVVQVGNMAAGPLPVTINLVMSRELDLKGTLRFGHEYAEAVRLLVEGAIDLAPLITAELPLAEAERAFALAADRSQSIKVVLHG